MSEKLLAEQLADRYVKALEEHGLEVPRDARGYDRLISNGSVRWEIRRQLIDMDASSNDSQGYILQKLLQDAVIQYNDRLQREPEIRAIARTAEFFRIRFAAQMGLWKAMVRAAHEGRMFTDVELECHRKLIARKRKDLRAACANAGEHIERMARAVVDREHLDEHGLLFDRQMEADVSQLVGNALRARPTLLVGDKGIAKTQLARFVCALYGHDPVLVSIKGDTTTGDLIGRAKDEDAPYPEGPVPYAMRHGLPVLLDEMNFGDQAVIARLHDILLRRPGDTVHFPELGERITVAPGFVVFATANEASQRYRQRQTLDPALRDRFEVLRRTYPDLDPDIAGAPAPVLERMALAYAVDEEGVFSRHIDDELFGAFVKTAAASQRLYVLDAKRVMPAFGDAPFVKGAAPDRPLIEDCISPRTVCRVVADSAGGNLPGRNLDLFLIDTIVSALDQDGTRTNADAVRHAALQAGINLFEDTPDPEECDNGIDSDIG